MEINGSYSPIDQTHLINELTQGMELARQLRTQMGPEFSTQTKQILLQQIVSSYDKALFILGCGAPAEHPHQLTPCSPSSINGSPKARSNGHYDGKECSLKRKSAFTWTNQVKLNPEKGLDGPPDDGYSWRKYGQKDIHGAKYPRSYYRCTYRNVQDCWATRQVQRSDQDPAVFDITYKGNHTCNKVRQFESAPTTPGKLELKQEELSPEECHQDYGMITTFQSAVPFEIADVQNLDSFPSTELGYFPMSPLEVDTFANNVQHQQHYLEGGIGDIVFGATSSTTSSPIIEPNFVFDSWSSFNPNFTLDSGFFLKRRFIHHSILKI